MDLLSNLWKLPRGIERSDGAHGTLTWKAKYGSIIATAFDLIATDGMNEEGFAGHILWLAESDYGKPEADATQLSQAVWLQYYLDNFATVADAVAWTNETQVQIAQLFDPTAVGPVLFMLIGNPISGAQLPKEFLASPWGAIGQWLPPGAGNSLLRDTSYFPDANVWFPILVLCGWAVVGLLLVVVGHFRDQGRLVLEEDPA